MTIQDYLEDLKDRYNEGITMNINREIPNLVRMVEIMAEALQVIQDHSDDKAMALGANVALQKASEAASEGIGGLRI